MEEKKFDLEDRLIDFSVVIVLFVETLPKRKSTAHLSNQLLRSGTSSTLNYGEARAAESRVDFLHKMKVCLKELRETYNCLRILKRAKMYQSVEKIELIENECNQLISIFVKSVDTASKSK